MTAIQFLLNLLWIVLGGFGMALGWVIAAVIMAITIIGIPWARAAFNIARYTLLPFGYKAVSRDEYLGQDDIGTGPLGVVGNIIWLVLAGWWLALVPPGARHPVRHHHHRHPVRLGALQARRAGALADRQDDRAERFQPAALPAPGLRRERAL